MRLTAIQGEKSSYSEEAALSILNGDTSIVECFDFEAVFAALKEGRAEFAVIPVKNKIVGEIEAAARLLRNSGFRVIETVQLEVRHVLAGTNEADIHHISTVRSHVEALKQCKRYFLNNPGLRQVIGSDTAASVREIVEENDPVNAAICSRRAAETHGAKILLENIADDPNNWTTFCLISP